MKSETSTENPETESLRVRDEVAVYGLGTLGVVKHFVHADKGKASAFTPSRLIRQLKEGLAVRELDDLQKSVGLPMDRLAPLLGISKATLHRRRAQGRLDPGESDRVVRFARLMGLAVDVLESVESARAWLQSAQVALGGAVPIEYAGTEVGAREVEDLLGRIEFGVYS